MNFIIIIILYIIENLRYFLELQNNLKTGEDGTQ